MVAVVAAVALVGFAGAALASVLAPKISLSIGLFFFVIGVWWANTPSKFAILRNFVFIYASSLIMMGCIVALGFGIMGLTPLYYWVSQYQVDRQSLALSATTGLLFLWGTGEAVARGLKKVALKKTPTRNWFEALVETIF